MKCVKSFINGDVIVDIQDITEFVNEQRELLLAKKFDELRVPKERIYPIESNALSKQLRLGNFEPESPKQYTANAVPDPTEEEKGNK